MKALSTVFSVFSLSVVASLLSCSPHSPASQLADAAVASSPTVESDLPPVGRSLFDQLIAVPTGDHYVLNVPYPFDVLVAQLATKLDRAPETVLFPGGRSLQRNAAGEQKFAKPRVVLGVTGDSLPQTAGGLELLLKNRLFMGFSEAAQQMEVISYNEAAGRFEFEIVEGYGPGLTPSVKSVSRRFCEACHQNISPIFSAAPWDETNANQDIYARLKAAIPGDHYFGAPLAVTTETPYNIDLAVQDANYNASYQLLWRSGCGVTASSTTAATTTTRCRRLALALALSYRATGSFDTNGAIYTEFNQLVATAWQAQLPTGVDVPNSEIKNYDPLREAQRNSGATATGTAADDPDLARLRQNSDIPVDKEPLTPRTTPLEQWSFAGGDGGRLIFALAGVLSDHDLTLLQQVYGSDLGSATTRLDQLQAQAGGFLTAPAFGRCAMLHALLDNSPVPTPNCGLDPDKLPPVQVAKIGSGLATSDPELAPFNTYCSVCHTSGPYPFLAGGTVQQIKNNLGRNAAEHIKRLSWESGVTQPMPPPTAPEHADLARDPALRRRMIQSLQNWQQP